MIINYMTDKGWAMNISMILTDQVTLEDVRKTIRNSRDAQEMADNLNALGLLSEFSVSRETNDRIRLKAVNRFGKTSYLEVTKTDEKESVSLAEAVLYIRKMPQNCHECATDHNGISTDACFLRTGEYPDLGGDTRPSWCPLFETKRKELLDEV